jgi:hypothetical protein
MVVIQWGTRYVHQRKIPKYCITASSGGFDYGTRVLWYNSEISSSLSFSTWISILCNQYTWMKSASKTLYSKCGAAQCMDIRGAKNIKYN